MTNEFFELQTLCENQLKEILTAIDTMDSAGYMPDELVYNQYKIVISAKEYASLSGKAYFVESLSFLRVDDAEKESSTILARASRKDSSSPVAVQVNLKAADDLITVFDNWETIKNIILAAAAQEETKAKIRNLLNKFNKS